MDLQFLECKMENELIIPSMNRWIWESHLQLLTGINIFVFLLNLNMIFHFNLQCQYLLYKGHSKTHSSVHLKILYQVNQRKLTLFVLFFSLICNHPRVVVVVFFFFLNKLLH